LYYKNLSSSKISGKINIYGNSGWFAAKGAGICTGNGIYSDPYIIEDLVIDGGGSGSCISISNSYVYFRIKNCSLYNAGVDWGDGGIKLYQVDNGQITNNSANNNDFIGIMIQYCQNITISGNTANSNIEYGIGLWNSHYNVISENTFKFNGWGLSLETSHRNNITLNNATKNINDGMGIWNSFKNIVSENNMDDNYRGLFLYNCIYNEITGNTVSDNNFGIYLTQSQCNNILNTTYSGNTIDISGSQGACSTPIPDDPPISDRPPDDPPPYNPLPINPFQIVFVVILPISFVAIMLIAVILLLTRRSSRREVISADKPKEIFRRVEKPIRETVGAPEEQPEKVKPSKPHIIRCPFCGTVKTKEMRFCPQCGSKFKKK
jgi:parallel beta-helix repeat protein